MEQAKKDKSQNAKETRPGNRRQRQQEMNEDFGDVYNNNEASILSDEPPQPKRSGLPPRGSNSQTKHNQKVNSLKQQKSMPVDASPQEKQINLD